MPGFFSVQPDDLFLEVMGIGKGGRREQAAVVVGRPAPPCAVPVYSLSNKPYFFSGPRETVARRGCRTGTSLMARWRVRLRCGTYVHHIIPVHRGSLSPAPCARHSFGTDAGARCFLIHRSMRISLGADELVFLWTRLGCSMFGSGVPSLGLWPWSNVKIMTSN